MTLRDDRAVLRDDHGVGSFEILGLGSAARVVEQFLERRAIDARVELCARPLPGRPCDAGGLSGEGKKAGRAGGCSGHAP